MDVVIQAEVAATLEDMITTSERMVAVEEMPPLTREEEATPVISTDASAILPTTRYVLINMISMII